MLLSELATYILRGRHGDIDVHVEWHAWQFLTLTFIFCGRRGTSFSVAGVALVDIDLHVAWQAWHLVTSTLMLRGRRGTW